MSLQDIWNGSKGVENQDMADGTYKVKVLNCKTGETKQFIPKIEWETEVVSGPQMGKIWLHRALDSNKPFTIDKAKQDFINLGIEPEFQKMKSIMAGLIGKVIEVKLKTNDKGFQDRTIVGMVAIDAVPVEDGAPF